MRRQSLAAYPLLRSHFVDQQIDRVQLLGEIDIAGDGDQILAIDHDGRNAGEPESNRTLLRLPEVSIDLERAVLRMKRLGLEALCRQPSGYRVFGCEWHAFAMNGVEDIG